MPKTMKSADASANVQTMLASLSKPNNMLPNLSSEKNEEIKNKLMLASFLSRRLVAGASIACSGAEGELNSKTVNLDLIINASANIIMRKDVGGGTTQSMLELCHKDITFLPLFKKCKKCGTCEPIIENNEWQGYDETYKIGEGYGLNKDEAYMICTKGEGYIYPTDDGQRNIMREYGIINNIMIETYLNNLNNYDTGKGNEKNETIRIMGKVLLQAGFKPEFVAGMLGNIVAEGTLGFFESSAYFSIPEPDYLVYMDTYFNYRNQFSGKNIQDVGIAATRKLLDDLKADKNSIGMFGLGTVQWTGERTYKVLEYYEKVCGENGYPTIEQCLQAEGLFIVEELKNDYKGVYNDWCNDSRNLNTSDSVELAAKIIFEDYETPDTDTSEERQQNASQIYNAMKSN